MRRNGESVCHEPRRARSIIFIFLVAGSSDFLIAAGCVAIGEGVEFDEWTISTESCCWLFYGIGPWTAVMVQTFQEEELKKSER